MGTEFVAMKQTMDISSGLQYKLRMMGGPIDGPTHLYGDNMSTIHNTQCPESQLKKKSNSICYHTARETVVMEELLTGHVTTDENPAGLINQGCQWKKKSNSICYHAARETVVMEELLTGLVTADENPAGLINQGGQKRKNLVQMYLYDIHDGW